MSEVDGIGIPDLIRVSKEACGLVLQVGDIKDSRRPYETQKVAGLRFTPICSTLIARECAAHARGVFGF